MNEDNVVPRRGSCQSVVEGLGRGCVLLLRGFESIKTPLLASEVRSKFYRIRRKEKLFGAAFKIKREPTPCLS